MIARSSELGELLSREEGKPHAEGIGEVYRAGVDAINSAFAGSGEYIIGLSLKNSGSGHLAFSEADEARLHQLILVQE